MSKESHGFDLISHNFPWISPRLVHNASKRWKGRNPPETSSTTSTIWNTNTNKTIGPCQLLFSKAVYTSDTSRFRNSITTLPGIDEGLVRLMILENFNLRYREMLLVGRMNLLSSLFPDAVIVFVVLTVMFPRKLNIVLATFVHISR